MYYKAVVMQFLVVSCLLLYASSELASSCFLGHNISFYVRVYIQVSMRKYRNNNSLINSMEVVRGEMVHTIHHFILQGWKRHRKAESKQSLAWIKEGRANARRHYTYQCVTHSFNHHETFEISGSSKDVNTGSSSFSNN